MPCNSAAPEENAYAKFEEWSNSLISKMKEKYEMREINAEDLLQKYKAIPRLDLEIDDHWWEKDETNWSQKLGK